MSFVTAAAVLVVLLSLLSLLQLLLRRSLALTTPSSKGWLVLLSSVSWSIAAGMLVVLLSLLTLQQLLLRLILTLGNPSPRGWLEERRGPKGFCVEIISLVAFVLHHFMACVNTNRSKMCLKSDHDVN